MKAINFKRLIVILLCLAMIISGTAMAFADDLDEPVTDKRLDAIERRLKAFSWKESAERILDAVTV